MPTRTPESLDAPLMLERQDSFRLGVDTFARPALLGPEQSAWARNLLVEENGTVRTRGGMKYLNKRWGPDSLPSGLAYFDTPAVEELLCFGRNKEVLRYAANGANFMWDKPTMGATVTDTFPNSERVAWAQGINKLLLSDGVSELVLYDGTTWASQGDQVGANDVLGDPPVGATLLLYTAGRMFASGAGATGDTIWASSLLGFGQGQWNHVLFSFRVGEGDGQPITALAPLQGQRLAVFKTNSIYVVDVDPTATTAANWRIDVLTLADGCVGPDAVCALGNEVLFWGNDGVRSVTRMAAASGQWEVSPPLSQPAQAWLDRITPGTHRNIRAIAYAQYALFAVALDGEPAPWAVLVWNARTQSWMGVWRDWRILAWVRSRFQGVPHLDVLTTDNLLGRWDEAPDRTDPLTFKDFDLAYDATWVSRGLWFGDAWQEKDLLFGEFRLRRTQAEMQLEIRVDGKSGGLKSLPADYVPVRLSPILSRCPVLPFALPNAEVQRVRVPLSGSPHGTEVQVSITTTGGNFELQAWSLAALPGMLQCQ